MYNYENPKKTVSFKLCEAHVDLIDQVPIKGRYGFREANRTEKLEHILREFQKSQREPTNT